jgi:hypothetical protein
MTRIARRRERERGGEREGERRAKEQKKKKGIQNSMCHLISIFRLKMGGSGGL